MLSHERKCRSCGNVAVHESDVTPWVLCKKCGSQDTRRVKVNPTRDVVYESTHGKVYAPDEQGNMATLSAGHMLCCDLSREIISLRENIKQMRPVVKEANNLIMSYLIHKKSKNEIPDGNLERLAKALESYYLSQPLIQLENVFSE